MKRPLATLVLGVFALGLSLPASSTASAQPPSWSLEALCDALDVAKQAQCRLDVQQALNQKADEDRDKNDDESEKQKSEKDKDENSKKKNKDDSKKKSKDDSKKKNKDDSKKKSEDDSKKKSKDDSKKKSEDDSELPPLPELSPEPEDSDAPPLPEPPAGTVKSCQIATAPPLLSSLWIASLLLLRRRP